MSPLLELSGHAAKIWWLILFSQPWVFNVLVAGDCGGVEQRDEEVHKLPADAAGHRQRPQGTNYWFFRGRGEGVIYSCKSFSWDGFERICIFFTFNCNYSLHQDSVPKVLYDQLFYICAFVQIKQMVMHYLTWLTQNMYYTECALIINIYSWKSNIRIIQSSFNRKLFYYYLFL